MNGTPSTATTQQADQPVAAGPRCHSDRPDRQHHRHLRFYVPCTATGCCRRGRCRTTARRSGRHPAVLRAGGRPARRGVAAGRRVPDHLPRRLLICLGRPQRRGGNSWRTMTRSGAWRSTELERWFPNGPDYWGVALIRFESTAARWWTDQGRARPTCAGRPRSPSPRDADALADRPGPWPGPCSPHRWSSARSAARSAPWVPLGIAVWTSRAAATRRRLRAGLDDPLRLMGAAVVLARRADRGRSPRTEAVFGLQLAPTLAEAAALLRSPGPERRARRHRPALVAQPRPPSPEFWGTRRLAAAMLVPYLGWVTFATLLNADIWHPEPLTSAVAVTDPPGLDGRARTRPKSVDVGVYRLPSGRAGLHLGEGTLSGAPLAEYHGQGPRARDRRSATHGVSVAARPASSVERVAQDSTSRASASTSRARVDAGRGRQFALLDLPAHAGAPRGRGTCPT